MKATEKEQLIIEVDVFCPECGDLAEIHASRKSSMIQVICSDCGMVERAVMPYGAGVKIGDKND